MDAVTAFLQGNLDEEVYADQAEGYNYGSGRVCKLNRAMYGLKQAGRQWNKKLDQALISFGLTRSSLDPCIYIGSNIEIIVAIYVDDILIVWKDRAALGKIKDQLCGTFKMKELGQATNCVGIEIKYTEAGIAIGQTRNVWNVTLQTSTDSKRPTPQAGN